MRCTRRESCSHTQWTPLTDEEKLLARSRAALSSGKLLPLGETSRPRARERKTQHRRVELRMYVRHSHVRQRIRKRPRRSRWSEIHRKRNIWSEINSDTSQDEAKSNEISLILMCSGIIKIVSRKFGLHLDKIQSWSNFFKLRQKPVDYFSKLVRVLEFHLIFMKPKFKTIHVTATDRDTRFGMTTELKKISN
jgi:hypothetical protein